MKRLITIFVSLAILTGSVSARELQYPPVSNTQSANSSNVVPITLIAGAVITTGLILLKVHKVKQARAARFNVYVMAKAGK